MTKGGQVLSERVAALLAVAKTLEGAGGVVDALRAFERGEDALAQASRFDEPTLRDRDGWKLPALASLSSTHPVVSGAPADLHWLFPAVPVDPVQARDLAVDRRIELLARAIESSLQSEASVIALALSLARARDKCLQDQARGGENRRVADEARESIQGVFGGLKEVARTAIRSDAGFDSAHRLIQQLGRRHVISENVAGSVSMTVDPGFLARIDAAIRVPANEGLDRAHERIRRDVTRLTEDLSRSLAIGAVGLAPAPLNVDQVRQEVVGRLRVDPGAGGSQPARGFMQRVSEGRRPVYVILMMVSLFGAPLGLRRGPGVAIAMALLFVVGILLTYRTWRTQDEQRKEKLLLDTKKRLAESASRAQEEFHRSAQSSLAAYLGEAMRQLQRSVDEVLKSRHESGSRLVDEERESIRARTDRDKAALERIAKAIAAVQSVRAQRGSAGAASGGAV